MSGDADDNQGGATASPGDGLPVQQAAPNVHLGGWIWMNLQRFVAIVVSKATLISGLAVFGLIVFFLVRPFDSPAELPGDNAAVAWNTAIERLGIQPLYPPQEDFLVGDVYITLDDPESEIGGQTIRYPSNVYKGRGVKIGRIDMRESIKRGARAFRFPDTKIEDGKTARDQPSSEPSVPSTPGDLIDLSLVAFPGISVKHYIDTESGFWRLFAGRRSGEIEEISIPYAESYGAPVVDSLLALGKYCSDQATAEFCTDDVARKILGYTLGKDVEATHDNKYIFPVSISIVGQVFLARELRIKRYRGDSLSTRISKEEAADKSEPIPTPGTSSATQPDESKPFVDYATYENRQSSHIQLNQVFARPVAFGFRRVSFALPRSKPMVSEGDAQ
ncbi:hypothetical protein LB554_29365 [Mesorhizobium sp. CO1-1-11]|uniref:hypothetical protein n=1 Tax=Mesorhizobium sp. CO1-1-11 TaxID=2876636 RepID=UPI001CCE1B90|nr:hypothetical protein [Mesorhizobium sp. CO1-1-11]MBZ9728053.1 hypothetical protein [Mesorhizobium sp. CO1-1-11]